MDQRERYNELHDAAMEMFDRMRGYMLKDLHRIDTLESELARLRGERDQIQAIVDEYANPNDRKAYVMMGPYAFQQLLNKLRDALDPARTGGG